MTTNATHRPQLRIPATYMRGGTSKGVFFQRDDIAYPGHAFLASLLTETGCDRMAAGLQWLKAGAHLDLLNTFALTTQFLGEGVRTRGLLPLEEGVRAYDMFKNKQDNCIRVALRP